MKDVIIAGGGAVGTSIARELSKYKLDILLLEKNTEVCQETTKANSAIIHGGYDAEPGSLKALLNVKGTAMFQELSKDLEFVYKKIGSMVIAFDQEDQLMLEELYKRGIENGVPGMEIIDGKRARELEPLISEEVTAALYCKSAGIVDPFNYTYAMMENAIDNGASLETEREVIGLEKHEDHILVKTDKGEYKTRYFVNAAGLNSDKLANMSGDFDFKLIPTKGIYRLLRKDPKFNLGKVLFQTPTKKGKGVLVTSTYEGNTMVGPTSEMIKELVEPIPEEESLETLDRLSKRSIPTLDIKKTIRIFTGIRAKPDTRDFMIYASKNMEGVVHAAGIESPGLSSAPAIAIFVKDLLEEKGLKLEEKEDFNPYRKRIPRVAKLPEEEKQALIVENDKYAEKICRCETVSEGEVVEAINRGAVTVDGVKRRVRAGMGFCQGNYCRPKVTALLARELDIAEEDVKEEMHGPDLVEKYTQEMAEKINK
nr:NAD(P)/FAD-dependent oxidoreductase [Tissierella sp.]